MTNLISDYISMCEWNSTRFLIFSENVFGPLIYYSHLLPMVVSLLFAIFIFFKNPKSLATKWLLITSVLISLWLFFDLILWATEKPQYTMFFWSIINMIEPMIYAGMLFFVYAFIKNEDLPFRTKLIIFGLLLPTVVLTPTSLALIHYDLSNCYREAIEGPLVFYGYLVEIIITAWILWFGISNFMKSKSRRDKFVIALVTIGAGLLLLSFAFGNVLGSILVDWVVGQYGLFGIPVFVALLGYLIVRYNIFNVKLLSTQALVASIWVLTLAILFLREISSVRIIVSITLILFTILGYLLIKSVKREVEQKEKIEKLAKELKIANKSQDELLHFITHQIKGFLTKSRNIFAEMMEGTFGPISGDIKNIAEQGLKINTDGVNTVQTILNAANIRTGKLSYNMAPIDLRDIIQKSFEKNRKSAESKGLDFVLNIGESSEYKIKGDENQLSEAFSNLIDNSIKYTPKGEVKVSLIKSDNKIRFSVKDTGIGIAPEDKSKLFTEGGRAKNALEVNVDSTGFGLYIVKNIIEAHNGRVWVESEEEGKGSEFIAELPYKDS